jgi:hypothetical protein
VCVYVYLHSVSTADVIRPSFSLPLPSPSPHLPYIFFAFPSPCPHFVFTLASYHSELKDVKVDSRIKVLSFHEDYRPPYKGTFSKTSTVLTGRNPFEKDHNVFNYDFDSEGEWEEGDGEGNDYMPYLTFHLITLLASSCHVLPPVFHADLLFTTFHMLPTPFHLSSLIMSYHIISSHGLTMLFVTPNNQAKT